MIIQNKKGKMSNSTIGIIAAIVVVILVLVFSFNGTRKGASACDLPLGACVGSDGKVVAGVTSQADCDGVVDATGIKGIWNEGQKCYQIGMNNALAPLVFGKSFTVDTCKNNPKSYKYFEIGVCLVNLKPVVDADTKVKCEGQGTWDATLSPCTAA